MEKPGKNPYEEILTALSADDDPNDDILELFRKMGGFSEKTTKEQLIFQWRVQKGLVEVETTKMILAKMLLGGRTHGLP